MEITKEFHFEMAHVLSNHPGLCGNLHGHSYRVLISFVGNIDDEHKESDRMIIDFNDVKKIIGPFIDSLDHCFAYNENSDDPFEIEITKVVQKHNKKCFAFPYRTTAEDMSQYMLEKINKLLDNNYELNGGPYIKHPICSKVQLYETATGSATATRTYF